MQSKIDIIAALGDNFIYLCNYSDNKAFVVDPGSAQPVDEQLSKNNLDLTHIFVTHAHYDHVGGVRELKNKHGCQVIGGYSDVDMIVKNDDVINLGDIKVKVISTPGHTRTSVCYYVTDNSSNGSVFTGDTLFVGGCGRPFECAAETLWNSLQKLAELPNDTLVYSGHDYTLDNYEFALSIEPNNESINTAREELRTGKCPVPSTIGKEKKTNLLLSAESAKSFEKLRNQKDSWG